MTDLTDNQIGDLVRSAFSRDGVPFSNFLIRRFPGETIVVVEVGEESFVPALSVASALDEQLPQGFVTIKKTQGEASTAALSRAHSLLDPRVNHPILWFGRLKSPTGVPKCFLSKSEAVTAGIFGKLINTKARNFS
jgi:hypothetical protein